MKNYVSPNQSLVQLCDKSDFNNIFFKSDAYFHNSIIHNGMDRFFVVRIMVVLTCARRNFFEKLWGATAYQITAAVFVRCHNVRCNNSSDDSNEDGDELLVDIQNV